MVVKNFFSAKALDKLHGIATNDDTLQKLAFDLNDQTGKKTKLTLWYTPGNDAYGLLTKSKRMVDSVANLLERDAPVYPFQSKLLQKTPKLGEAWERHQNNGN